MTSADAARQMPWLRYALLGATFSALWLALSLFASLSSASADEHQPGGLLGAVGSVVGGVTEVTGAVGDTLGHIVDTVAAPVGEALEPVADVAPAPIAESVPAIVVDTTTDAANGTVSGTNIVVGTVVNGLTGTLSDMAGGGTVGGVTAPVTGLLDGVVGSVPIGGELLGDDAIGGVVAPLTGFVDGTLGAVVGSTGELPTDGTGMLPLLPAIPLLPGGSETPGPEIPVLPGGVTSQAGAVGAPPGTDTSRTRSGPSGLVTPLLRSGLPARSRLRAAPRRRAVTSPQPQRRRPRPPAAPARVEPALGGGASGTSDAAFAALGLDALASLVLHSVDDELPSSPVYDTDTTPD